MREIRKGRIRCKQPTFFPCGCVDREQNKGGTVTMQSLILLDGTKVCRCGRRWALQWAEIPHATAHRGEPQK